MSKEVMRHEKVKGKSVTRAINKHNRPTIEVAKAIRDEEIKSVGVSSICLENLKYNYALIDCEDFDKRVKDVLSERLPGKTLRKDAVTLLDGVYTMSPDKIRYLEVNLHLDRQDDCDETKKAKAHWRETHKEWVEEYKSLSKDERMQRVNADYDWVREYAQRCVEFEKTHYGECISAQVHFHEDTIHIHTNTIPLIKGNGGAWRLSAKDIVGNKSKMSEMQTLFHEEVGSVMGLERGVCRTSGEIRKHMSKVQMQCKELEDTLAKLQKDNEILRGENANLRDDYESLKGQYSEALDLYMSMDDRIGSCNQRIGTIINKMTTASKRALSEQLSATDRARSAVEDAIKSRKSPDAIIGGMRRLAHQVRKLEETIDGEDEDLML